MQEVVVYTVGVTFAAIIFAIACTLAGVISEKNRKIEWMILEIKQLEKINIRLSNELDQMNEVMEGAEIKINGLELKLRDAELKLADREDDEEFVRAYAKI